MLPKRFMITLLIAGLMVIVIGFAVLRLPQTKPTPRLPKDIGKESPDQALQEVIKLNIKQDLWPEQYNVVREDSGLARLGLGRKYADSYKVDWRKGDTYFLAFIGYDKKQGDLIGYVFNIYVKGIEPAGPDLARIYIKDVPEQGWIRSSPKAQDGFISEISTTMWKEVKNKIYLEVLSLAYKEPQFNFIPGEAIKDITVIRLLFYMPNNPEYSLVEEFQRSAHSLYGQ